MNFPENSGVNQLQTFGSVKSLAKMLNARFFLDHTIHGPGVEQQGRDARGLGDRGCEHRLEMQLEKLKRKRLD
jgi:hypothetical protein